LGGGKDRKGERGRGTDKRGTDRKGEREGGGRQAVGPHLLFVGGGGPSLSVGACCLQARVGSFSSVGGCCVCGWASRWGSFSSVGGCCVCGCLRSRVGVTLGAVLVSGVLLWGGFVIVVAFSFPVAGVVRGRSSFVGGGRSSGVDDGGGGVVLARSGCDVALPRRCRPSLRRPILSGSFWFSLTVVASR
jgi:hypothetical protein